MAQQEVVQFVDDLDGGQAQETVSFGVDGRRFEIDLSTENATALREHLATYIACARRRTRRDGATVTGGRPARPTPQRATELRAVREWARAHGFEVAARGRVRADVLEAYHHRAGTSSPASAQTGVAGSRPQPQVLSGPGPMPDEKTSSGEQSDEQVLAWHEAKDYKIPADRKVTGLMRHRFRAAHTA